MLTLTQTGLLSALCLSQIRWYNKRKHWRAHLGGPQQQSGGILETGREKASTVVQKCTNQYQWNERGWRCINTDCTQRTIFMMTSGGKLDRPFMCVRLGRPESSQKCAATFHNGRCYAGLLQIRHLQKANKSSIMLLCAAGQSTKNR